jgi:hypothetical protein
MGLTLVCVLSLGRLFVGKPSTWTNTWGNHSELDEPRIATGISTRSNGSDPNFLCSRCGRAPARQRDRPCCETTLYAIRSPAYRICTLRCISDLVRVSRSTEPL